MPQPQDVEQVVRTAWMEEFGDVPEAEDADFFQLGGNSLGAVRFTSELRRRTGLEVTGAMLFRHPTRAAFAAAVAALAADAAAARTGVAGR